MEVEHVNQQPRKFQRLDASAMVIVAVTRLVSEESAVIHVIVAHTLTAASRIISQSVRASKAMTVIQNWNASVRDVDQAPNALEHMLV